MTSARSPPACRAFNLGGEAPQCSDQQGRPGPRRRGTVFPDRYHAEIITSPTQARHALSYVVIILAEAPRGSERTGVDVEARLVLERDRVPRLVRIWRRGVPVARPADLRSARGLSAKNVAAPGRLEEVWVDLVPRGAVEAAMSAATPAMTAGQPCDLPAELGDDRPSTPAMTAPMRSPGSEWPVGARC